MDWVTGTEEGRAAVREAAVRLIDQHNEQSIPISAVDIDIEAKVHLILISNSF
jgi:NAD(P)H-hydrate repair Nnr-like enzyme with NAD(P)H-hydrate epimerase domain